MKSRRRVNSAVGFLLFAEAVMGRLAWLKWELKYGNRKTRLHDLKFFIAFEFYSVLCRLGGYRTNHWLGERPPRPPGKYLRVIRPAPLAVELLDKIFTFGEETHSEYLPYTPEALEQMQQAGKRVAVCDISYRLHAAVL